MRAVVFVGLLAACRPPGYGKVPSVDSGVSPDGTPAVQADAATTDGAPAAGCHHGFRLDQHGEASSVWLSGDFVSWAPSPQQGAIPFVLGADSGWTVAYDFAAGPHLYKFIIDGNDWILDPTDTDVVDDGMGNQNSRYICTP